jgi:predicted MFS family arabinose efflux permease
MLRDLPKNVWILTLIQPFYMSSAPLVILIGGLLGAQLAPQPAWATLPIAVMIIGTALSTVPAALLMQRFGRKRGMAVGLCIGILGAWVGTLAAMYGTFSLLLLGSAILGSATAFAQQIRFIALESIHQDSQMANVVMLLTVSSLAAAFLGPEIAVAGQHWLPSTNGFAGSYLMLSGFFVIALIGLWFFVDQPVTQQETRAPKRPLSEIFRQPIFLIALAAATVGYGTMSFVMTGTPVSMHDLSHLSLVDTKWVIQSHIVAMFLPGLITGKLIMKWGHSHVILAGIAILLLAIGIGLYDQQLMHYWFSLVLIGVGWNFLFFGGTTLLKNSYRDSERYKAQALNDFVIFTVQAFVALSAGVVVYQYGWNTLLLLPIPVLVVLALAAWMYQRHLSQGQ